MLAEAWREVRYHPGRVVATLIAIAISVAFIAGGAVFLGTEQSAIGKQGSIQYSATDIVATPDWTQEQEPLPADETIAKLRAVDGVQDVDPTFFTTGLFSKDGSNPQLITLLNVPADGFRWAGLEDGTWAQKADEVTLTKQVADRFGVSVGDTLTMDEQDVKVVGISDDPTTRLNVYSYIGAQRFAGPEETPQGYNINLEDGADADAVIAAAKSALPGFDVLTAQDAQDAFVKDLATGIDVFRYLFGVFQFIAVLVGMIIIANTFTILVTQRRRQIGLLRAVGASSGQVQRKFLAEAVVLGALGSLGGILLGYVIAAAGSAWTGSLQFGISFPWLWLLLSFVIGVVITVAAAFIPVMKTTRVSPLEALQPVLNADAEKRVSRIRTVVILVFAAIGVAMALMSFFGPEDPALWWALGATFFLVIAVLFGAPLYVPTLLRLLGRLVSWRGPTARLAVMNSARNPQRAAATAVALMLAMGLIVTMQVGTATIRTTLVSEIEEQYPVDLTVQSYGQPLTTADQDLVKNLDNVDQLAELRGGLIETDTGSVLLLASPDLSKVTPLMPTPIPDDVAYTGGDFPDGSTLTLTTTSGESVTLTIRTFNDVGFGNLMVSESTMEKLVDSPQVYGYWIKVVDRGEMAGMMSALTPVLATGSFGLGGGAMIADLINTVLDVILLVVTALLAVAVTIALVGVANTLGLSVIERTRESALLRALGMKRGSLRIMLLIEAVLLAVVGTVVGLIGGSFLAWMGIRGAFRTVGIPVSELKFDINLWQTLILLAVAVGFAALASILPGRRAAMASPTEALATE
ncbi:ABC transporter permease [Propionibacteriaceae bacterium Y1923]